MFNFINCDLYAGYWCPMIGNKLYSIQFYSTCSISTMCLSVYQSNLFWDTINPTSHPFAYKSTLVWHTFQLLIKALSFCIHSHLTSNCVLKQFCGIHFFFCIYCLSNHSFWHTFLTSNLPSYQTHYFLAFKLFSLSTHSLLAYISHFTLICVSKYSISASISHFEPISLSSDSLLAYTSYICYSKFFCIHFSLRSYLVVTTAKSK